MVVVEAYRKRYRAIQQAGNVIGCRGCEAATTGAQGEREHGLIMSVASQGWLDPIALMAFCARYGAIDKG
jgi:hypothetical protein